MQVTAKLLWDGVSRPSLRVPHLLLTFLGDGIGVVCTAPMAEEYIFFILDFLNGYKYSSNLLPMSCRITWSPLLAFIYQIFGFAGIKCKPVTPVFVVFRKHSLATACKAKSRQWVPNDRSNHFDVCTSPDWAILCCLPWHVLCLGLRSPSPPIIFPLKISMSLPP